MDTPNNPIQPEPNPDPSLASKQSKELELQRIQEAAKYLSPESVAILKQFTVLISQDPYIARRLLAGDTEAVKATREARELSGYERSPYFKEFYALELRDNIIIPMLRDGKDRVFKKEKFPTTSLDTLSQKIRQALCYLCLKLEEPDLRYNKFKRETYVTVEKNHDRVKLGFDRNRADLLKEADILEEIKPEQTSAEWMPILSEFIQADYSPDKPMLKIEGLDLSNEDIDIVLNLLGALKDSMVHSVTKTMIKVIKKNPSTQEPI